MWSRSFLPLPVGPRDQQMTMGGIGQIDELIGRRELLCRSQAPG